LQKRLVKAEASIESAQAKLQKSAQELARAHDSERRARDETAELRGQVTAEPRGRRRTINRLDSI
jgi:hypothetical protein